MKRGLCEHIYRFIRELPLPEFLIPKSADHSVIRYLTGEESLE